LVGATALLDLRLRMTKQKPTAHSKSTTTPTTTPMMMPLESLSELEVAGAAGGGGEGEGGPGEGAGITTVWVAVPIVGKVVTLTPRRLLAAAVVESCALRDVWTVLAAELDVHVIVAVIVTLPALTAMLT